ncbi:MAG: ABC transporter permease [Acidimicrobiia bacterium]|nr:ABC transporter permease [Acidimicrobiia bacterium]
MSDPTSSLPAGLERLAAWLPSTHAWNGCRATMLDDVGVPGVWSSLMMLCGSAVIGVPRGLWLLARAMQGAREEGTLGHV